MKSSIKVTGEKIGVVLFVAGIALLAAIVGVAALYLLSFLVFLILSSPNGLSNAIVGAWVIIFAILLISARRAGQDES